MASAWFTALGILAAAAVIIPVIVLRSHHAATARASGEAADAQPIVDVPPP